MKFSRIQDSVSHFWKTSNFRSWRYRARTWLFGRRDQYGVVGKGLLIFLVTNIAIIYLYPFFQMVTQMLMTIGDIRNPTVNWIPPEPQWENVAAAIRTLSIFDFRGTDALLSRGDASLLEFLFGGSLWATLQTSVPPAIAQVAACSVAGYAFGRLKFPGRSVLFAMLIITLLVPPQALVMPQYQMYRSFGLLDSPLAFVAPALFGHGIRGALFVIIYSQFFRSLPKELEEAAEIDGATPFRVFWRVMLPLAKPAMAVVFLFSMVWHWNETYLSGLYFRDLRPLAVRVMEFELSWAVRDIIPDNAMVADPVTLAAGVVVVAPLIVMYLFVQRWFTESLERTGIAD
ncbi:MAG: carbohydrate ABC transporter permease [Spirochaetota bacterium]